MISNHFESASATDVGLKRKNNEDACLRLPNRGMFCVADGMGGQIGGDLASQAIVKSLQEVFHRNLPEGGDTLRSRCSRFQEGISQASQWIKKISDEKGVGQMGSTVVGLILDPTNPHRAACLHAGDSRLYRWRDGQLSQITTDHSTVAVLAAKLGRPPESFPAHYQNGLLRAVGLAESVELEKQSIEVVAEDLFLLCSDGLTKMLKDDAIRQLLLTGQQGSLEQLARQLIDAANQAGGRDNITVILIRAGQLPPEEETEETDTASEDTTLPPPEMDSTQTGHPTDFHEPSEDTPKTENPVPLSRAGQTCQGGYAAAAPLALPGQRFSPAMLLVSLIVLTGATAIFLLGPRFAKLKSHWQTPSPAIGQSAADSLRND